MEYGNQELKVFIVAREADWGEDDAVVVFAIDESHAEHCARCNSSDFATGEVTITEVAADEEKVILVSNTGHELKKLKKLESHTCTAWKQLTCTAWKQLTAHMKEVR